MVASQPVVTAILRACLVILQQVYQKLLQSALNRDILRWGPGVTLRVTVQAAPAAVSMVRVFC
jgi:hypothetical protein